MCEGYHPMTEVMNGFISHDAPGCKWWLNCAVSCVPEWSHALQSRDYPKPVWKVTKAITWVGVSGKLWRLRIKTFLCESAAARGDRGVITALNERTAETSLSLCTRLLSCWTSAAAYQSGTLGALLTALGCCCCCCWSCLMSFLACSSSAPASSLCCLTVANSRLTR